MLPIEQQITFLYTHDLATSAHFYEKILELKLWRDQGTCRIYYVGQNGLVGLCQRDYAVVGDKHDLIFTIVTPDVDGWYNHLLAKGVACEKPPSVNSQYNIYHFFLRDPNGYLIEVQRFLD